MRAACPRAGAAARFADLVAQHDELPVARLRAAGALIFGKTNVPEFTMQGYTDNPLFGATGNPWNPALTPGGSSGGAVALVAAGCCPLALGTDGGGSIRRPASHTNLVGYKPSRGRIPRADGLPQIFLDYEVVGPIARCVDDAVAVLQVLAEPDARDASSTAVPRPTGRCRRSPARPCRVLYIPRFADHPVDPRDRRADRRRGVATSPSSATRRDGAALRRRRSGQRALAVAVASRALRGSSSIGRIAEARAPFDPAVRAGDAGQRRNRPRGERRARCSSCC